MIPIMQFINIVGMIVLYYIAKVTLFIVQTDRLHFLDKNLGRKWTRKSCLRLHIIISYTRALKFVGGMMMIRLRPHMALNFLHTRRYLNNIEK